MINDARDVLAWKNLEISDIGKIDDVYSGLQQAYLDSSCNRIEEWLAVIELCSYSCRKDIFRLPIHILKNYSDPPDFVISSEGLAVRVEIVISVESSYEEAQSYCRDKLKDGSYPSNTSFMYPIPKDKKSWGSLFQKSNGPLIGPAVYGDYGRIHTSDCICSTILAKIEKYKDLVIDFDLAVCVKTPSRCYCDELNDRIWVKDDVCKKLEAINPFSRIYLIWSMDEVYMI